MDGVQVKMKGFTPLHGLAWRRQGWTMATINIPDASRGLTRKAFVGQSLLGRDERMSGRCVRNCGVDSCRRKVLLYGINTRERALAGFLTALLANDVLHLCGRIGKLLVFAVARKQKKSPTWCVPLKAGCRLPTRR